MKNKNRPTESYTPINKGQFTLESPNREAKFEKKRGFGVDVDYTENRRQWSEYPIRQYVAEYPLHIDVELSSLCNLRCPMCYTITDEFKNRVNAQLMNYNLFTRIVDECAEGGVYSMRLSFRGESFLHPRIVDCISYAKQKGIKEVSTLTNGLNLDEKIFRDVMEAGLDWLTISFDGLGEIYEKIRRPAKYKRAVEKIANYDKIKKESGRVKPVVKVQSILPAIQDDPKAFYDVFAPITDMVSANPLIDFMQDTADLPKITNFVCPQIFQRMVVGADGLCMMCSNDEEGLNIVGNAWKESIHGIWHGSELKHVREVHVRHKGCDTFYSCKQCYLPLVVYEDDIVIGERKVIAEKYISGTQQVAGLKTPKIFKRSDIGI